MLVPPNDFGLVESGIYRCTKLESDNFPFLETLRLKLVILLDAEKPPRNLTTFMEQNSVELYNLGGLKISNHHHHTGTESRSQEDRDETKSTVSFDSDKLEPLTLNTKNNQWMLIEKNLIAKAFELLLNKHKHNLLLIDSTSTLVGILRKIQKWNFNSILNEYRIYCGNSSNNYYAENFLELIQIELVSYEMDQAINKTNKSLNDFTISTEDTDRWVDDTDVQSIDDDDMDDDILSASPKIPANLLKLVEQRKIDKNRDQDDFSPGTSPGTSPGLFSSSSPLSRNNRSNSFTDNFSSLQSRRKSIESKFVRMSNNKFRKPSNVDTSFESSSPSYLRRLRERSSSVDMENLKLKFDYNYYKNLNQPSITFENISILKLRLPQELKLPDWFIRGRSCWEEEYNRLNEQ